MKLSLLKQLEQSNNNITLNNSSNSNKQDYTDYNEIPTIQYEQLDQLRCYVDLAVLLQDEYHELLQCGKEDFLTNYEQVDDIVSQSTKNMYKNLNIHPYINIGLDLFEFLQNAMIVKIIIEHSNDNIPVNEFTSLFNNVCTNGEEIAKKFICLLLFFELASISDNVSETSSDNVVNMSKFVYACNLASIAMKEE